MDELRDTQYNLPIGTDCISRQAAIDIVEFECGEWRGLADTIVKAIEQLSSAQPKIEERKEESAQNVPKEDLISRKEAIEAECEVCQIAPKKERGHNCTYYVHGCKEIECLRALPSEQPTLYGYDIEHLILIANVMRKENLPPERVVEALTDIGRIVSILVDEFEESLRKAVEQCKI